MFSKKILLVGIILWLSSWQAFSQTESDYEYSTISIDLLSLIQNVDGNKVMVWVISKSPSLKFYSFDIDSSTEWLYNQLLHAYVMDKPVEVKATPGMFGKIVMVKLK